MYCKSLTELPAQAWRPRPVPRPCRDPAWAPGSGTLSPPRRVQTRALAVRPSAATRLRARGSSSARPTSPVNSNSPSAASASPSAAHHFLRGSVGRPGRAPRPLGRRADLGPRGLHRAFLCFPGRGCAGADITGAPRGEKRGCGGPPLRDSGLPEEAPGSPAVGLGRGRSSDRRRRVRLLSFGASGREPRGSGQAQLGSSRAAKHLPIHGPDRGAHSAGTDGLTASGGRRQQQQGGSGDRQTAPLRNPGRSEVEGEWETGAETRDAPATAAPPPSPPPERVPASLHPAPRRRRPPWAPPSAALQLGSRAPSSCGRTKTPSPRAPLPPERAPRPRLLPALTGARALCFPLRAPPALPRALPAFRLLCPGPPSSDTSLYRRQKLWGPDSGE